MSGTFVTDSQAVNPFDTATKTVTSNVTSQPVREVTYPKGQAALEVTVSSAVAGSGRAAVEVLAADTKSSDTALGADAHRVATVDLSAIGGQGGTAGDKLTVPFYSNKRYLQVRVTVSGTVSAGVISARIVEPHVNRTRAGQKA